MQIDAQLNIPVSREVGAAIKALARGAAGPEQQKLAWDFIVYGLGAVDTLSYRPLPGPDNAVNLMLWREGRRFVGGYLQKILNDPMTRDTPPEPPARTMTEKHRRRTRKTSQSEGKSKP